MGFPALGKKIYLYLHLLEEWRLVLVYRAFKLQLPSPSFMRGQDKKLTCTRNQLRRDNDELALKVWLDLDLDLGHRYNKSAPAANEERI